MIYKQLVFVNRAFSMADLEFLEGVSALPKTPAKLEVKTQKKVVTSSLSHFLLAAASLPFSTAPKPTH